jgi:rhodanese-related sulfurtransferase
MAPPRPTPGAERISPADTFHRCRAGEAVLLDVREEDEYAAGHAPHALPLPHSRLTAQACLSHNVHRRPVLCVCRSGNRSRKADEILTARGVTALNVTGGMRTRALAGLPVHTDQGQEGQVR